MTHIFHSKLNCLYLRAGRAWGTNQIHTNRSSPVKVVKNSVGISIGKDNGCAPLLKERYMTAEQYTHVALLGSMQNVCKIQIACHWL